MTKDDIFFGRNALGSSKSEFLRESEFQDEPNVYKILTFSAKSLNSNLTKIVGFKLEIVNHDVLQNG